MERFQEISTEDQDLVLKLGFACYDRASNLLNHDLQDTYEAKVASLKNEMRDIQLEHEKRIGEIQEKSRSRLFNLQTSHRTEIQRMKEERDSIVEERVTTAVNAIKHERSNTIDSMCDTIRKDREHETFTIRSQMGEILEQMKSLIHEHRQTNDGTVKDMMNVIQSLKGASTNSTVRGKVGESTTELVLDSVIPGCTWENMAGTGGKADFHANVPGIGKVLMDIKNHEKEHGGVPVRDRKKLMRDLDADSEAVGAILVATQANIHSGSHCQVMFTEQEKPMVCCLLHGDWERLRDAIETLRACAKYVTKVNTITSVGDGGEDRSEEAVRSLKEILRFLGEQEKAILDSRQNIVRAMTEANLALSRIDPSWNPSLREWLMVHLNLVPDGHTVPKDNRITLKALREIPGIPKEAKGKSGRDHLRDDLKSLGITMNADGTLPGVMYVTATD